MKKNYILDTNVLLHDPSSIHSFEDNNVLIPIEVVEEIDHFKREMTELGRHAREVSRTLDRYRGQGSLTRGATMQNGGILRILIDAAHPPLSASTRERVDNRILQHALQLQRAEPELPAIIVSKDVNLRIKADALGLHAEDYETDQVRLTDLYSGMSERDIGADSIAALQAGMPVPVVLGSQAPNEYVLLHSSEQASRTALARASRREQALVPLQSIPGEGLWGVHPRNKEQFFACDALLDDSVQLVTLMGKAGTGKTLLAIAAGLHKVIEEHAYKRLLITRPTFPMGVGLGFLPGTLEEKLDPWMQPIYDALELLGPRPAAKKQAHARNGYREWIDTGLVKIESLTYIRGRSISNAFFIVDEAQNLTPLEVKTVITRAGHNTKVIMTGDPWQIDNPYVDSSSNGFNYIVNRFRDLDIAAHIELQRGVRSALAEIAANVL